MQGVHGEADVAIRERFITRALHLDQKIDAALALDLSMRVGGFQSCRGVKPGAFDQNLKVLLPDPSDCI